jgi:hypothetical protein
MVTGKVQVATVAWVEAKQVVQDLVVGGAKAEAGTAMVGKLERAAAMGAELMVAAAKGTVEARVAWVEAEAQLVAISTRPLGPA